MSLVPSNRITARKAVCEKTSRSNRASAFTPQQGELVNTRLPLIPAFRTDMADCELLLSRRRASTSVQRSYLSGREETPSVMESPSATIAPFTLGDASTSSDCRKYHDWLVFANGLAASVLAKFPAPEM